MNPIRRLRHQAGVTQRELALTAGTSQPAIASYEAGRKSPRLDTLEKLAKAVGLEVAIRFVPPLTREDLRSLAYHQGVVEKLKSDPEAVLAKARTSLDRMARQHPDARRLFDEWRRWLELPVDELVARCLDTDLQARDLRQVTPFAGVLSAGERLEILKRFRREQRR